MNDDAVGGHPGQLGIEGYVGGQPIGAGGFGFVFRARQVAFDRDVAVKVLASTMEADSLKNRFERECKAIGALSSHPHIVTVYESGVDAFGRPFIAMDFMPGGSFADRVRKSGPMPWQEVVDVGVKLAGAVATAHDAGILHRDIKPENVLLSGYGQPKLADFGISTVPGGYHTHTGVITGSLSHAAPETMSGRPADESSDVYSLASTLFFMVSGRPPFRLEDGEPLPSLIARILNDSLPDLRASGIPDVSCSVLERALAKDPSERIATAVGLGLALQDVQRISGLSPTEMPVASTETTAEPLVADPNLTRRRLDRPPLPSADGPMVEKRPRRGSVLVAAAATVVLLSAASAGVASGWIGGSGGDDEGSATSAFVRSVPSPEAPASTPSPSAKPKPDPANEGRERRAGNRRIGQERRRPDRHRPRAVANPANAGTPRPGGSGSGGVVDDITGTLEEVTPSKPDVDQPPPPPPPPSTIPAPPVKQPPVQPPPSLLPSAPPQG